MSATPLMPVEEALERVLASVAAPTEREAVALAEAYGRTLASDVVSRRVQPPFANSAMDGYALRAADAARAPARLTVVGESAAGRPFDGRLGSGEAARIFTGAPLPEGADAVAMQENARREGETVILDRAGRAGRSRPGARRRFRRRRDRAARRPPVVGARRRARRRRQPPDTRRPSPSARRDPRQRRRTGRPRRGARTGADRLLQHFRRRRHRRRGGRGANRSRHRRR